MASKTVDLRVNDQELVSSQNRLRQSAEITARDMIRASRSYSTSAKEVLRDIEEQIKAIEKRNKLNKEFEYSRLESTRGNISEKQYSREKERIDRQLSGDNLEVKLLRDIIDTIKHTSKEEIREDRKNVESTLLKSKTINKLGVEGDEFTTLKQTLQQDEIGRIKRQEGAQRNGFRFGGVVPIAQQAVMGDTGGALLGGGMRMLGALATNPYAWIIGGILAGIGGTLVTNKNLGGNLRDYGVSHQMGLPEMVEYRKSISGSGYTRFGMTGNQLLKESLGYNRAMGGRDFSGQELTGLTAITKSRDVSSELLSQTIGYGRYSNSGNLTTVITNLEDSIRKMYGGEEFKRKLIQLPEMMQVYNSLAAQMIATTGRVDQAKLSSFIGGVGSTFGVEGQNLQRYSSGIKGMMGNTGNRVIGSIQAELIRKKYPHLSGADLYQKMLEIQEAPQDNPWFMEGTWSGLQNWGGYFGESVNPNFRSAAMKYGNFGAAEAREMFGKSLQFDYNTQQNTSQSEAFEKFAQAAEKFYSWTEKFEAGKKDDIEDISRAWGSVLVGTPDGGTALRVIDSSAAKTVAGWGQNPNSLLPQPKI